MRWCSVTSSAHASSSRTAHRWINEASRPPTSVQVIARTGFTDSSPPIVALPPSDASCLDTAEIRMSPADKMEAVNRVLAGLFLIGLSVAGAYGYTLSERERAYRQHLSEGDGGPARGDTAAPLDAPR